MARGTLSYMSGFGNEHASEAVEGALPVGQNNPQKPPLGLYAEQLSGTAFTAPRAENRRTWMYRIRPSVLHVHDLREVDRGLLRTAPARETDPPIGQLRWDAIPIPDEPLTWLTGLRTIATNGDVHGQFGMAAHIYLATESMTDSYFYDADGELLVMPQEGRLRVITECGSLDVEPTEICVMPRGLKFRVELPDGPSRGYVCENYGSYFELPERGPIGANGMANSRDFLYPTAAYEDSDDPATLFVKFDGRLFASDLEHSPLDVVAWHGNHAPYKYDLRRYNTIGSISFDHPDPSIFTVMTSRSDRPGTANIDFAIFPDRWLVAEHTFRPPYYHVNIMSEFMGLIYGIYDAKPDGFNAGGMSLHNSYWPHGPDSEAWEAATNSALEPEKLAGTLAFMFETRYPLIPTTYASSLPALQEDYQEVWAGLRPWFGR
ncbi:MAG: homogentisate 1,2-dioxygenase [Acidimicrobiia bacterium]